MRWAKSEYILKGVFLGLLVFVSLQKNLDWAATGRVALWLVGGFLAGLVCAAVKQFRDLKNLGRNPLGFFLFLLLENPFFIYAGIVFGMAGAAIDLVSIKLAALGLDWDSKDRPLEMSILGYCVLGGALFGYGMGELRQVRNPFYRFGLAAVLCAAAGAALYLWLDDVNLLGDQDHRTLLGVHLLLGIPFFYLLVFCGMAEESEVEIAALCATLGLGIWLVQFPKTLPALGFLLPVGLYCVYTIRILRPLRVFKHALRGYGHMEVGRTKDALASFNRALQLDPRHHLARHGLVRLHRGLTIDRLDAETRSLLNPNLVVSEAAGMLIGATPSAAKLKEANDLLSFVEGQWSQLKPATDYYKAVADTHARILDSAVERLSNLLDPAGWPAGDQFRDSVLFDAWQLALRTHPELKRRVGDVQLPLPGRRVEALRAIERQLGQAPGDPAVVELRRELFADLTEADYAAASAGGPPPDFGYAYAEEVGVPLLEQPENWRRGALLVRIAAHGQAERGPGLFLKIAEAAERHGDAAEAKRARQRAREFGHAVGPANLDPDQRAIYFAVVKKLGEEAAAAKDWKEAIYNYTLYSHSEGSGKETLRTLAQMYENDGQVLQALKVTEDALTRGSDKDLTERKDRYYYSVEANVLRGKADEVRGHFDVKYCLKKAKQLLDSNNPELDVLDWATHLSKVALVMEPKNLVAAVQMARCHLRRGERDEGMKLLEDVREMQSSGGDEREAREWTLRQLGSLYLDDYNRPDLAIECLKEFLDSEKSGARTRYDLGRAYEAQGDPARALKYYEQAAAYEDNPVRWDAEEAIRRVKDRGAPSGSETA
ncbi:MAG TPA: tetratricopeptide repeat protein [Gemmataceae bacterium]|nr:tetratricopeptide repeat protein [Gemmataceae bacterium]